MHNYYDEAIGSEPIIPAEIIDFLSINKLAVIEVSIEDESMNLDSLHLDEHERAMVA
jgi:hypothetical protein